MAHDFNLLENIEVIDLNLFDTQYQIEQLLDDVSFLETNSSFNFLNVTNYNQPIANYQTYESPIRYVQEDYGSLPVSDQEANQIDEETPSEEESKTEYIPKLETTKIRKKLNTFDKPPEPYADMIAKAIMSSEDNSMQLKDIYTYMTINYESFTSKVEISKWKSAIRHNLSSHSFFIKTSKKNAQGHYWSIEPMYLHLIKEKGTTIGIKKCLNKKPKSRKSKKQKMDSENSDTVLDGSLIPQSNELNEQVNYSTNAAYNDSAFYSSNDNDNSQLSLASTSTNSSYNYKFLMNSPTFNPYTPYYSMSNQNVNYVNFLNQQELNY